jgi:hypothetical protein
MYTMTNRTQYTKEAIACSTPTLQVHMLAQLDDLAPIEVLAIARVHAGFAIHEAEAIIKTAGCSDEEAAEYVAYLRANPHPALKA